MKKAIFLFTILFTALCFSQSVNDYKYVVIPNKFDFQKKENEYNLNNLVKMMFEKYGFEVYIEGSQKPAELALNRCKALYADVQKSSGFLTTNITIALNDCAGKTLFTTQTGKSKEKDFKTAYYDAIRKASSSIDGLNYKYTGSDTKASVSIAETSPATAQTVIALPLIKDEILFAQPISNGYQLVDSKPQVVLRIYKTSKADSFTAISNNYNGLVFKKGEDWYFEYYKDDVLISEKLNIKF
jgi:hypothetical protein